MCIAEHCRALQSTAEHCRAKKTGHLQRCPWAGHAEVQRAHVANVRSSLPLSMARCASRARRHCETQAFRQSSPYKHGKHEATLENERAGNVGLCWADAGFLVAGLPQLPRAGMEVQSCAIKAATILQCLPKVLSIAFNLQSHFNIFSLSRCGGSLPAE